MWKKGISFLRKKVKTPFKENFGTRKYCKKEMHFLRSQAKVSALFVPMRKNITYKYTQMTHEAKKSRGRVRDALTYRGDRCYVTAALGVTCTFLKSLHMPKNIRTHSTEKARQCIQSLHKSIQIPLTVYMYKHTWQIINPHQHKHETTIYILRAESYIGPLFLVKENNRSRPNIHRHTHAERNYVSINHSGMLCIYWYR